MTRTRQAILPAVRPPLPILAVISIVAAVLGGCASTGQTSGQTSGPASGPAPSRPPASVLALPSTTQLTLASASGVPASRGPGRRDVALGGPVIDARGPSTDRVDVRSDQRLVNGRVFGTVWWRSRSVGIRTR